MASPVTIQPAIADSTMRQAAATTLYGGAAYLVIDPANNARWHNVLTFDFSATVPAGATIDTATLSLNATAVVSGRTITTYRLRRTDWVQAEVTWNVYKTGSSWGTAGALDSASDYDATDSSDSASLSSAGWQNWIVTAQVQYARDNTSGVVFFFQRDAGDTSSAYQQYRSSEFGTPEYRPKLYIEYTEAVAGSSINIGDSLKAIDWPGSKINIGDVWKTIVGVFQNIGDAWKEVYSAPAAGDFILLEDGSSYLLQETNDKIKMESSS